MDIISPATALSKLLSACNGCASNFTGAVNTTYRHTTPTQPVLRQQQDSRLTVEVFELNTQLQRCLQSRLQVEQKLLTLRESANKLQIDYLNAKTAREQELSRLKLMHERQLHSHQQTARLEAERRVRDRMNIEREEEQGWNEVTRLRQLIAIKEEENRECYSEIGQLWDGIRRVGSQNQQLMQRIQGRAKMLSQSRHYPKW